MTTLGGMFETKPRSKRNFLLENIRDVCKDRQRKDGQTKSQKLNQADSHPKGSQAKTKGYSFLRHKCHEPVQKLSLNTQKHLSNQNCVSTHLPKRKPCLSTGHSCSQTPSEIHSSYEQRNSGNMKDSIGEEIDLPDYKHSYIDEENIPFRWTQVCPSIISHSVCHQAVQTIGEEDLHSLFEDGCIKYPSSHNRHEESGGKILSTLEWPTCGEEEDPSSFEIEKGGNAKKPVAQQRQSSKRLTLNSSEKKTRSALKPMRRQPIPKEDKLGPSVPWLVDSKDQCPSFVSAGTLHEKGVMVGVPKSFGGETGVQTDCKSTECLARYQTSQVDDSTELSSFDQLDHLRKWTDQTQDSGLPAPVEGFQQKGVLAKYSPDEFLTPEEQKSLSQEDQTAPLKQDQKAFSTEERKNNLKWSDKFHELSQDDRRKMLQLDSKAYDKLVAELNKMPVRTDTLRTKRRKMEIEKELDQLERRIRALTHF